jgi:hypothetical protein
MDAIRLMLLSYGDGVANTIRDGVARDLRMLVNNLRMKKDFGLRSIRRIPAGYGPQRNILVGMGRFGMVKSLFVLTGFPMNYWLDRYPMD